MFESATARLSIIYLVILTVVCSFFSYNWYNVATRELDRGIMQTEELLQRQPMRFGNPFVTQLLEEREDQLRDSKRVILARILLVDIIILGLGAAGSYLLARRTLRPIAEAHEAQTRFSADASHEFRTPLTAIRTQTEVALMDKKLPRDVKELLNSIVEEVDTMTSLSDELLLLARQHSKVELHPAAIHPPILKAVKTLKPAMSKKHLSLKYNKSNLTACTSSETLQHIITILLQNAVKYSPESTTIYISTKKSGKHVYISVRDEGQGIPPKQQQKVFERFYRAATSRTKQNGGHGLGLAIAKRLSQSIDAELTLSSHLNKGSTFTLILPA